MLSSYNNNICKCAAFRLDDFDDVNFPGIEMKLLDLFYNTNTSLTIGIIAGRTWNNENFLSANLHSHLVKLLHGFKTKDGKSGAPKIEVANHSWQHEDFSRLSLQEQNRLMRESNAKIHTKLGIFPSTFITPFNKLNKYTYQAAAENGINVVSSDPLRDPPTPYQVMPDSKGMYHLPYTALTARVDENEVSWDPMPLHKIQSAILRGIKNYGYAVIEMHPQEFVITDSSTGNSIIDQNHLHEVEDLIHWLHSQKIKIITLREFANEHTTPEFDSSFTSSLVMSVSIVAVIIIYTVIPGCTKKRYFFCK
jgi:peptidoglycan/xylan/chitin deacetylase (PgdA/CDA1 family)